MIYNTHFDTFIVVWVMMALSEAGYFGGAFKVFIDYAGFFLALIPGMWAAYRGLKALVYYLHLRNDRES